MGSFPQICRQVCRYPNPKGLAVGCFMNGLYIAVSSSAIHWSIWTFHWCLLYWIYEMAIWCWFHIACLQRCVTDFWSSKLDATDATRKSLRWPTFLAQVCGQRWLPAQVYIYIYIIGSQRHRFSVVNYHLIMALSMRHPKILNGSVHHFRTRGNILGQHPGDRPLMCTTCGLSEFVPKLDSGLPGGSVQHHPIYPRPRKSQQCG